jgi:BlaI family transcriptional regulator, penicillinase repressor
MQTRISPAEWEVLNIVWDRAPITSPEVYQALADDREWHPKTVNTFLARLAEKGVLAVEREGKTNVYTPLITRAQCVRQESENFLQRVFRGALTPMMAHFVEHSAMSDEDIAELQRLLKQRAKKGGRK